MSLASFGMLVLGNGTCGLIELAEDSLRGTVRAAGCSSSPGPSPGSHGCVADMGVHVSRLGAGEFGAATGNVDRPSPCTGLLPSACRVVVGSSSRLAAALTSSERHAEGYPCFPLALGCGCVRVRDVRADGAGCGFFAIEGAHLWMIGCCKCFRCASRCSLRHCLGGHWECVFEHLLQRLVLDFFLVDA